MSGFTYHRPQSLAQAESMLASQENPKLLAGGMSLLLAIKHRSMTPSDLIDLSAISELAQIKLSDNALCVGAMATHDEIATNALVRAKLPVLSQMANAIGDPQVRALGTLGGAMANNDPAADYPAALVGLAASVETNQRTIAAHEFIVGERATLLRSNEIILSVTFESAAEAAYERITNPASGYPLAAVLVAKFENSIRVAITGAAPFAYRERSFEQALMNRFHAEALASLTVDYSEFNSNLHASAEYRAQLVCTLAKRAVMRLQ